MKHRLDTDKAVEVLLYVTRRVPDMYTALKVVYFADKRHLANYGRFIYGDSYVAMKHGPVPSAAYDILKSARGDDVRRNVNAARGCFSLDEQSSVTAHRKEDLGLLSDSDRECLDAAISEYGRLSFAELKARSHNEPAFQSSGENDFIPIESIVASLPDADELMSYIKDC